MTDANLTGLARAGVEPQLRARLKSRPEDFVVRERLGQVLSGTGEHVYLRVRKTAANTAWVAEQLAQFAGAGMADVSYAGRKDRHAITEQWFSLWLPDRRPPDRRPPDWQSLSLPGVEVLEVRRHDRKLRRAEHAGNDFEIRLRGLESVVGESPGGGLAEQIRTLDARLQNIRDHGFANYFGPQRFGRNGANLTQADELFAGGRVRRELRGLCLSAVRSQLFNLALSAQLGDGRLPPAEPLGAPALADGRGRSRSPAAPGPQGWLYGTSRRPNEVLQAMASEHPVWCAGLQAEGLKAQQRALWVVPDNLVWRVETAPDNTHNLWLAFGLPTGSYATSLIRETVIHDEG